MEGYVEKNNQVQHVISTRVRFARNIADYPFASRMDQTSAREIIEKVQSVLPAYEYIDFHTLDPIRARSYVEKHFVSPNFLTVRMPHGLLVKDDLYIMLCEEDHMRVQCIVPGLDFDRAFAGASAVCDALEDKLPIAYNERLGYLTHCPTNLGTGMRASVMMFLPALTFSGAIRKISQQLSKMGLTMRGIYGEGSEESGCLYQVSNQITLGISEEDTISKLKEIVDTIIENEKRAQKALDAQNHDKLHDSTSRALGTMKYAITMSSEEFMNLYGKVRFGLNIGCLKDVCYETLDQLSVAVQPATISLESSVQDAALRDKIRAEKVRNMLCGDCGQHRDMDKNDRKE